MPVTHYQLLELKEDANQEEIEKAYAKQCSIWESGNAKNWLTSDDQLKIVEKIYSRINQAYETLKNDYKRGRYDSFLELTSYRQEESQEEEFKNQWEALKTIYTAYDSRYKTDEYINYLRLQISTASNAQAQQLNSQSVIERAKIEELEKRNNELEYQLVIAKNKYILLNNQVQQLKTPEILFNLSKSNFNLSMFNNVFNNRNNDNEIVKFKPPGLETIYKIVPPTGKNNEYQGIKLVFENKEKAENLQEHLNQFLISIGKGPFILEKDISFDYIYEMKFFYGSSALAAQKNPEKTGALLLLELSKYVDISGIPQEFRFSTNEIRENINRPQ